MRFLDTNIFLRHLITSDPAKARTCFELFQAIEQEQEQVWTSDLVVAEVVFVLSGMGANSYQYSRADIRDELLPLLSLPGLHISSKLLYPRIFELYTTTRMDFVDAYHVALMEASGQPELYSYDSHFDRIPSIRRIEP
jgi:predicted nucleic acid-binding protein